MSEITIGQYYHENSIIHKLDPRVKLLGTMLFIVALFCVDNFLGYITVIATLGIIIIISKIPFVKLIKGIRGIIYILLLSVVFNLIYSPKGNIIIEFWIIRITDYGVYYSLFIACRLVLLVISSSILTLTTKPSDLADGLEKVFSFLKIVKVPVHEIALIMSLALRFIPTLMEETKKIMKAQKARGAAFDGKNLLEKTKSFIPLLVPLFISSINRALELAVAMEARCYNGGVRTKLYPLRYKKRDYLAYSFIGVIIVAIVALYYITNIKNLAFLKIGL